MFRFFWGVNRMNRIRNKYIGGAEQVGLLGTKLERPD